MAYIERFNVKGRPYYRMVHTVRKGGKITHLTRYLGSILPPRQRLEHLKKEFLKQIRGQKYRFLSAEDLEGIESKKALYRKNIKKLSLSEKERDFREFIVRFTYDSSKLSGVDVTLRQTSLILREGIMPKDIKNLKIVKELENHRQGILVINRYRGRLSLKFIKKLHKILLSGVDDTVAGKLRSELKRDVKIEGTPYVPPRWQVLGRECNRFFKWYTAESRKLHPLELAALVHLKIISMQPFVDGNSRLSRLLMNWILWKKGYPPVDIPAEELEDYYNVLDRYQIEKDEKPFVDYIKRRFLHS